MGTFHISGLGLYPGAVTVPLTYIYFLLREYKNNSDVAKQFFGHSGEQNEQFAGKPEALIIFTSKQVIQGQIQGEIIDQLFNTPRQESSPKTIMKYLKNMIKNLNLRNDLYGEYGVKYLYFVEVEHTSYIDCFKKIYLTIKALVNGGKEIWCNMIGGTNQINLAILMSTSFTQAPAVLYYVFETDTKLMHPSDIQNVNYRIENIPSKWTEILPFMVSQQGTLLEQLRQNGLIDNNSVININQLERILEQNGYNRQFIATLRGRWVNINGEIVQPGPLFTQTISLLNELDNIANNCCNNFSRWKEYFLQQNWLHRFIEDGEETQL